MTKLFSIKLLFTIKIPKCLAWDGLQLSQLLFFFIIVMIYFIHLWLHPNNNGNNEDLDILTRIQGKWRDDENIIYNIDNTSITSDNMLVYNIQTNSMPGGNLIFNPVLIGGQTYYVDNSSSSTMLLFDSSSLEERVTVWYRTY